MAKQSSWRLQYKEAAPISSKKNDELCQTEMGLVYLAMWSAYWQPVDMLAQQPLRWQHLDHVPLTNAL